MLKPAFDSLWFSRSPSLRVSYARSQALCTLLGSGGARSVEKAVLDFVATRVREMQVRPSRWSPVCSPENADGDTWRLLVQA